MSTLICRECRSIVNRGDDCECGVTWLGIVFYAPASHRSHTWLICDKMRAVGLASKIVTPKIAALRRRIDRTIKMINE